MILNIFSCPAQMDMKMNTNGQFFTNSFYQSHADLLELWSDLVYGNTDCGEDKKKKSHEMTFSQFKGMFSGRAVAGLIYSESLKGVLLSPQRQIIRNRS